MDAENCFRRAVIALHRYCEDQAELSRADIARLVEQVCATKDGWLEEKNRSVMFVDPPKRLSGTDGQPIGEAPQKWEVWP